MAFYTEMTTIANQLISEFGADCTIQKITKGTRTSVGDIPITETSTTVKAVVLDWYQFLAGNLPTKEASFGGTNVERMDAVAYVRMSELTNASVIPEKNDKFISSENEKFSIQKIKSLSPAGTTIIYILYLRT